MHEAQGVKTENYSDNGRKNKAVKDRRPPLAFGHVGLQMHTVDDPIKPFKALCLRGIFHNENFRVLKLPGGAT